MPSSDQLNNPAIIAYPDELRKSELAVWQKGKARAENRQQPAVGIGLSGGGIRSATFCLGVFQAFSRKTGLLGKIDYISSVSGGSFFASFYGRLFTRKQITTLTDVENILSPNQGDRLSFGHHPLAAHRDGRVDSVSVRDWRSGVFKWLRENGRYLAPNGNGDLLTGVTVFLRNWATVQVLLSAAFLAIFLIAQIIRIYLPNIQSDGKLWWSPFFAIAGLIVVFGVVPLGWAYWTFTSAGPGTGIPDGKSTTLSRLRLSLTGLGVLLSLSIFLGLIGSVVSHYSSDEHYYLSPKYLWIAGILIYEITFLFWQRSLSVAASVPNIPRVMVAILSVLIAAAAVISVHEQWNEVLFWSVVLMFALVIVAGLLMPASQTFVLINESESARGYLSTWLMTVLVTVIVIAAFALLDTLGETLYALKFTNQFRPWHWLVLVAGGLASVVPYARSIVSYLMPSKGARPSLSLSTLALLGAFIVVAPYLLAIDFFSHAISYDFARPLDAPVTVIGPGPGCNNCLIHSISYDLKSIGGKFTTLINEPLTAPGRRLSTEVALFKAGSSCRRLTPLVYFLIPIIAFIVFTGGGWFGWFDTAWIFLNRTSLHPLYSARLIRAYLGASNENRFDPPPREEGKATTPAGVTDPVDGDDIPQHEYFWVERTTKAATSGPTESSAAAETSVLGAAPGENAVVQDKATLDSEPIDFWIKGPPLHLVNVTINETIDGRSQTEQRDRKGVGMAIGPAGLSAGVHHHVIFSKDTRLNADRVFTPVTIRPPSKNGYRVFGSDLASESDGQESFKGETLSLGNWTAISGAAVSTGLGSLTSIGASILTAFFNVRLGYWWDSGTASLTPRGRLSRRLGRWIADFLPVQSSLFDEFAGRFRGTVRRYWYLTDGGHFENTGGYELIRRRLPLIIILDCGADSKYVFEDLSNLIRKARLDFNAEIVFLDPEDATRKSTDAEWSEIKGLVSRHFTDLRSDLAGFGTLEQLRRGAPQSEKIVYEDNPELSVRHAAIARIKYLDDPESRHYMILIKPTLIGEEPEDLLNYHTAHPSFPQETTAEQFFDEAQWESYRRLGQHIAEKLFDIPTS